MSAHEELLELAALHALGVLEPEDSARLDSHRREGCGECERQVRESERVMAEVALATPPLSPSSEARARLVDQLECSESRAAPVPFAAPRGRTLARLALAASVAVALLLGLQSLRLTGDLETERLARGQAERALDELRGDQSRLLSALESERSRAGALVSKLDHLTTAATRTVALAGTDASPQASARAYLDSDAGLLMLYVYDLPPLPEESSYQLWVIVGEAPLDAGVFEIDPEGRAQYDTRNVRELSGSLTVAVTIEPAGGVPQPSGPIVLAGKI